MVVDQTQQESSLTRGYHHEANQSVRRVLRFLLKYIGFTLLARVRRVEGLDHVPEMGPAILMINHIAFIDPIAVLHVLPRNIIPMAKIEVYNYPIVGVFPRMWGVIPIRREEVDRRAIQLTLEVLKAGEIVLVAPEGTRGPALKQGKEGIAYLASRSGAPIVPVAVDGTEGFPTYPFSKAWRKSGAVIRFGPPFRFKEAYRRAGREDLRKMTDEALYVLSAMLPPERRGYYSDLSMASSNTLELDVNLP